MEYASARDSRLWSIFLESILCIKSNNNYKWCYSSSTDILFIVLHVTCSFFSLSTLHKRSVILWQRPAIGPTSLIQRQADQ